jgi:arylsulfatase
MDRRDFLKLGLAAPLTASLSARLHAAEGPVPRYNVIWILMDTLRAESVGAYGYDRPTTPALDRLAAKGVVFEKNFAQGPHTLLSVPSCFTSRKYPCMSLGLDSPFYLFRTPPPEEKLASVIMGENGYHTCMINAHPWMNEQSRFFRSFKEAYYVPPSVEGNLNAANADFCFLVDKSIEWLDSPAAQEPFFLYIHGMDPHCPHILPEQYMRWVAADYPEEKKNNGYAPKASPMEKADQDYFRGLYDGSIRMADDQLGRLLEKLESGGRLEDTIIIYHSDHGEALGEDGHTTTHPNECFTDELLHVPLVMAGPGLPAGKRISELTENMDILPTLADALGLETDAVLEGKSLLPLITGAQSGPLHEYIFAKNSGYTNDLDELYHNMILRTPEWTYMASPTLRQQQLYRTPHTLTQNTENVLADQLDALPALRAVLDRDIHPLARAWRKLPLTSPAPCILPMRPEIAEPESAFIRDIEVRKDDKWSLVLYDLLALPWGETPPPITFRFKIPDGKYRVSMQVLTAREKWGHPASAFLYQAPGDTDFRLLKSDPSKLAEDEAMKWEYLLLGEYAVENQEFVLTLKAGDRNWWTSARRLLFEPAGMKTQTDTEAAEEKRNQLEALGYL